MIFIRIKKGEDSKLWYFQTKNEEQEEVRGPGPGHRQRYHAEEPKEAKETHQERKSSR